MQLSADAGSGLCCRLQSLCLLLSGERHRSTTIKSIVRGFWRKEIRSHVTWYEPLTDKHAITQFVRWVLGRSDLFMDGSLGEWSIFEMGLLAQNLILAAHSLGVEGCLQASVTNSALDIKKFLDIPESKKLVICISLGYPDEKAKLSTYRSLK